MYGLFMALAMLFTAGLCACSAQPHAAAETAPQTIVVGIDVFDPYSYLDRDGQFAGIDVERPGGRLPVGGTLYVQPSGRGCSCGQ